MRSRVPRAGEGTGCSLDCRSKLRRPCVLSVISITQTRPKLFFVAKNAHYSCKPDSTPFTLSSTESELQPSMWLNHCFAFRLLSVRRSFRRRTLSRTSLGGGVRRMRFALCPYRRKSLHGHCVRCHSREPGLRRTQRCLSWPGG